MADRKDAPSSPAAEDAREGQEAPEPRQRRANRFPVTVPLKSGDAVELIALLNYALSHSDIRADVLHGGFVCGMSREGGTEIHIDIKDLLRLAISTALGGTKPDVLCLYNAEIHARRWRDLRDRSEITGEKFYGERQEWELILGALREAQETGLINGGIARTLANALDDTLRGHPPVAWTRKPGHPRKSLSEERLVLAVQDYVHACRRKIINDNKWRKTVMNLFGFDAETYKNWTERKLPPGIYYRNFIAEAEIYGNELIGGQLTIMLKSAAEQYRRRRAGRRPRET